VLDCNIEAEDEEDELGKPLEDEVLVTPSTPFEGVAPGILPNDNYKDSKRMSCIQLDRRVGGKKTKVCFVLF